MELDCLILEVRILGNQLYQKVRDKVDSDLTLHHGLILGYIILQDERQISQREIETLFSIRRSTANHMFQLMEQNGYISREVSASDARARVIRITESGRLAHEQFHAQFQEFERQLRSGFSEQELQMLRTLMRRLWDNAGSEG